eukprot:3535216-Prymnesium_polylepis.2
MLFALRRHHLRNRGTAVSHKWACGGAEPMLSVFGSRWRASIVFSATLWRPGDTIGPVARQRVRISVLAAYRLDCCGCPVPTNRRSQRRRAPNRRSCRGQQLTWRARIAVRGSLPKGPWDGRIT